MNNEVFINNLRLMATHPANELAVAPDQTSLKIAASNPSATIDAVHQVIQYTIDFANKLDHPVWVKISENDGLLSGVSAVQILQNCSAKDYKPIQPSNYEQHKTVTIHFANSNHSVIADRDLLADHSDYFKGMLAGNFKEGQESTITISDIDPEVFDRFMNHINRNENLETDPNKLIENYFLAKQFLASSFENHSLRQLSSMLDIEMLYDIARNSDPNGTLFQDLLTMIPLSLFKDWVQSSVVKESQAEDQALSDLIKKANIEYINKNSVKLKDLGVGKTASEAIDWIIRQDLYHLEHADFTDFNFFPLTNSDLEKLTQNCPNLKTLLMPNSKIDSDALKHLEKVPGLTSLNMWSCTQLEADALKHLAFVPELRSLNIEECSQLEADALKHLEKVPGLTSLEMRWCAQLESDALKHLEKVPGLRSLDMRWCAQLESDALKHLEKVPGLTSLNIGKCSQLESDALKHLAFVPELTSLNIGKCSQLESDALKHLAKLPGLTSLNIGKCSQLESDALKHLEKVPGLTSLSIWSCTQLESDALKHLAKLPGMTSLSIWSCTQLESDALKHLEKVPGLTRLNIAGCRQLKGDALKHLAKVPGLTSLSIWSCTQLESDALKHLANVPGLRDLNIVDCRQLKGDALKHLANVPGLMSLNIACCSQLDRSVLYARPAIDVIA